MQRCWPPDSSWCLLPTPAPPTADRDTFMRPGSRRPTVLAVIDDDESRTTAWRRLAKELGHKGESAIDKKKRPVGGRSLLFIGHALLDLIFDYWAY
jgi:hypothetical protein